MHKLLAAAFALSFCVTSIAQISLGAQYQWFDQNGQMVFSDQPPPASVPLSRIIRVGDPVAPRSKPEPPGAKPSAQMPTVPAEPKAARQATRPSISEQMIAFDKRRAQRKLDRRKRTNQAKQIKAAATSCKQMQASKAQLDSGRRLRIRNKHGTMSQMTQTERLTQTKKLAKRLKKCRATS